MEDYAACFDELFSRLAQRRGFREYLTGLLAPGDRNKTLTGLAGAEPVAGAQHAAVQRLQYFPSQSTWDAAEVNRRRLELLVNAPATAPHARGVIAIDDSGDRKDGTATAHVGRQWLGRCGKADNGIVTVTTVWADERVYYPLHAQPYTPASHFPRNQADPEFRTKLQIAADLIAKALAAGVTCRAVVADSFYGEHDDLRGALRQSGLGFVMALKPSRGTWQYGAEAYTPKDAARAVPWGGPDDPGGSKFFTTTEYAPRLHDRLCLEQRLADDATQRGWPREVERHNATPATGRGLRCGLRPPRNLKLSSHCMITRRPPSYADGSPSRTANIAVLRCDSDRTERPLKTPDRVLAG
ncbi:IS701 family transposase [Plantactinospora sp. DSM 117369]